MAIIAAAIVLAFSGSERVQARQAEGDALTVVQLRPNVYVIAGAGSNIVMQTGPEGVILVDSGTTANADKVLATIRRVTDLPIRYIISTSMDPDHVGGNDKLARAGLSILPGAVVAGAGLSDDLVSNSGRASVLAHENVLARMTAATPAIPFGLFPTKTFAFHQYSMYLNGEGIQVIHMPAAHTDGDTMVRFRNADAIMTGDFYRSVGYPNIDRANGGSLNGMLEGLQAVVNAAGPNTKIIPGHGATVTKADVAAHRDMIMAVRDKVQPLVAQGKTQDEVVAAKVTSAFDAKVTGATAMTADRFVTQLYQEIKGAR